MLRISNIGSFGEGVYKIGLTRRLKYGQVKTGDEYSHFCMPCSLVSSL